MLDNLAINYLVSNAMNWLVLYYSWEPLTLPCTIHILNFDASFHF